MLRWVLLSLTGVCLAVLLLGSGLSTFINAPNLPGSAPLPGFHTAYFVPKGSRRGHSDRLSLRQLADLQSALPDVSVLTVQPTHRTLGFTETVASRQRIAFVAGPMWKLLGVRLQGATPEWRGLQHSLPGGGERQIVLSRRLAVEQYGSLQAALGQQVQLPDLMGFATERTVGYRVVAVVESEFSGPVAEDPVDAWIPLEAWHDVILPAHQPEDVADDFPGFVAVFSAQDTATLTGRLNSALLRDPQLNHEVVLMRGLGPSPNRRLALHSWSAILRASALVIALALVALHISQRWLALEQARHQDQIRASLGEDSARWWRRKLRSLSADAGALLGACALGLASIWIWADGVAMPVRESLRLVLRADLSALWQLLAVLMMLAAPLALHLALSNTARLARIRSGAYALVLVGVAATTTLMGAMIAVLSMRHADALFLRQLGWPEQTVYQATLGPVNADPRAQARFSVDRRPLPLLGNAAETGQLAVAGVAPLDGSGTVQARVNAGAVQWRGRLQLNKISANYFAVMGLQVQGNCPAIADLTPDTVIVNDAFLSRYGQSMPIHAIDLSMTILIEGIFPKPFRICGSVANVQFGDARGAPLPVVYRRATELGGANVVLAREMSSIERFRVQVATAYPDLQVGKTATLKASLAENLADDLAMARLARLIALASLLIASVLTAKVVLLAAHMQASTIATRWALGCTRFGLLRSVLRTSGWHPKLLVACLLSTGALLAMLAVPAVSKAAVADALTAGLVAMVAALLIGLIPVWLWLSEKRLLRELARYRDAM